MYKPSTSRSESINLALISFIVLLFTYTALSHLKEVVADEGFHNPQIWQFFHGNFKPSEQITVPPTYHAIVAGILKIFGLFSTDLARFIHLGLSALALPILYSISKQLGHRNNDYRTLLFLTCPISLPFFSLLYTDIPAIALVALTLLFSLQKKYILAGLSGGAAIAMRQPNLIWVIMCTTYVILDFSTHHGWRKLSNFRDKEFWRVTIDTLPYIFVIATAGLIFHLRRNVAVGDAEMHQISLNLSNLYMFLLLSFLFFLPYHIVYFNRTIKFFLRHPFIWAIVLFTVGIYSFTYSNFHPYNTFGLAYYYRNTILHYTVTVTWLKFLVFIPMLISAFTYYFFWKDSQDHHKRLLLLIYAFGVLSFVPLPMVEPRYYLTALALIIATKPNLMPKLDFACLFLYAPINGLLIYLISNFVIFI